MLLDFLRGRLGEDGTPHHTSRGVQYSWKCPLCQDHKERLFVHLTRKKFKCHNCQASGSIVTLISLLEGTSWKQALEEFRNMEGYDIPLPASLEEEIYERLLAPEEQEKEKFVYPLPEEFTLVENLHGKKGAAAKDYLLQRGVTLDMCERYYIGFCSEGKYADRIIMPDFEQGELVYWQARTILPPPKSKILKSLYRKALNPSLTKDQVDSGIEAVDKSQVISNIDFILQYGMAVLCEGKMDSYTIGDLGGCLHGKVMSDAQFVKLVHNKDKIGTVAIMLDGDALLDALKIAERLYQHFDDIRICRIDDPKADPNSLGRKKVLDCICNAEPYDSLFPIKAKLKGWA